MNNYLFRCSSIGKLMAKPKTIKEGVLSAGAKTYIEELAAQEIFGVDFEFSSKYTDKGIQVEGQSISLLNAVRGLSLTKNTERRSNGFITGDCDLYDKERNRGHDIKSSWSLQTFPLLPKNCVDSLYEWQMRGYMWLWDADEWEVNYCMVDTPDSLMRNEPIELHTVFHLPEHHRVTTWTITRDMSKETEMIEKIEAAREYMQQVAQEFDQQHQPLNKETA